MGRDKWAVLYMCAVVFCSVLKFCLKIMGLDVACEFIKCHFDLYSVLLCFLMAKTSLVARFCKRHRFSCQVDTWTNRSKDKKRISNKKKKKKFQKKKKKKKKKKK